MLEHRPCKKCNHSSEHVWCDECEKEIIDGVAVEIDFSWPSVDDGKHFHFCSDECFMKFFAKPMKRMPVHMEGVNEYTQCNVNYYYTNMRTTQKIGEVTCKNCLKKIFSMGNAK